MSRDRGVHLFDTQRLLPRAVQNAKQRRQRRLFGLKSNSAGMIKDKIDPVSGLEIEFPPDFDRDGNLPFARDGGLWHIPY